METKGHVWVMGAGAFTSRRLPVGLADRLAKLKAVFTIIREPLGIWLPVELRGIQVVRLADEFTNFTDRIDNYQRVARRVVEAARDGSEVMYITYGSPVIFDRVLSFIRNMCFEANLLCTVIPATSSVDALLAFVGEDMAPGLQICEARWLVRNSIRLDPRLAVLLFQVGVYWTDGLVQPTEIQTSHLVSLKEYLLKVFPAKHPAVFVRAPFTMADEGYANCRSLDELDSGVPQDLMGTSLYLPALSDTERDYKSWWCMVRRGAWRVARVE